MSENAKKFLELISENEELGKKLSSAAMDDIIAIAREQGIELTGADFNEQYGELSDDELDVVAGGWKDCTCVAGGGGKKDADGKACACVVYGQGDARNGKVRCACGVAGVGCSPSCNAHGS